MGTYGPEVASHLAVEPKVHVPHEPVTVIWIRLQGLQVCRIRS